MKKKNPQLKDKPRLFRLHPEVNKMIRHAQRRTGKTATRIIEECVLAQIKLAKESKAA